MADADRKRGGKTMAILLAGPIFLIAASIATWQSQPDMVVPMADSWRVALVAIPLLVMSMIFGGLIATLPVIIGATAMERLARVNIGCRLPAFWALAGGLLAGLPGLILETQFEWGTLALMLTGATCALICRRGRTWDDKSPIVPPRQPAICVQHDT